jgi:hypothetical protein
MKFHLFAAISEEAKTSAEADFAAKHPGTAFLIEPTGQGSPERRPEEVHSAARVCWFEGAPSEPIKIGRDPTNELAIPHPRVSRLHARLSFLGIDGVKWVVEDVKSANGTTIKGRRLSGDTITPIHDGDRLVLGDAVSLRPFFEGSAFHAFLSKALVDETRRETSTRLSGSTRVSALDLYERLARTFRQLGFRADLHESVPELLLETMDGAERVRISRESGFYAVEWGTSSVYVKRKTVSAFEAKVEEIVYQLILDATTPLAAQKKATARHDPLEQTHTDENEKTLG